MDYQLLSPIIKHLGGLIQPTPENAEESFLELFNTMSSEKQERVRGFNDGVYAAVDYIMSLRD